MKVSNPAIKTLIFDVLTFTDELDEKGARVRRVTFAKEYYAGLSRAKKKIADCVEVLAGEDLKKKADEYKELLKKQEKTNDDKDKLKAMEEEIKDIVENDWRKLSDLSDEEKRYIINERNTDEEIEFSEKEKNAIKFYYKQREEIQEIDPDALEEFEKLINE